MPPFAIAVPGGPGPRREPPQGVRSLVHQLFKQTETRLRGEGRPSFYKPAPKEITPAVREVAQRLDGLKRQVEYLEAKLEASGFTLESRGKIGRSSRERSKREQAWKDRQAERQARLVQLKIKALLDLVGLKPEQAKRYLLTLQKELARL